MTAVLLFTTSGLGDDSGPAKISSVTAPPESVRENLKLDPFYGKHVFVGPFSVVSSDQVADAALGEAAWLIQRMVGHRPDILQALAASQTRFAIMSWNEFTTDIPEHSDLRPADYWDKRARGLGATRQRLAVSCGEENLLKYDGDPYASENILIHEFGHAIHEMALSQVDPEFDQRLSAAYEAALANGLWKGTYAATNHREYWAEGVQSWFDTNREDDDEHNHVNTRSELKEYDPRLAELLKEVFGEGDWRYTRPITRKNLPHLRAHNATTAPKFSWPADVVERFESFQAAVHGASLDAHDQWSDVQPLPLKQVQTIRSQSSSKTTSLVVVNEHDEAIKMAWIDEEGHKQPYGQVAAGGYRFIKTYVGHVWLVTDHNGSGLRLFAAHKKLNRALFKD